jgi:predicted DNA binding CopG/RHH family protein
LKASGDMQNEKRLETEILESFESGDWGAVEGGAERYVEYAKGALAKDKRVNIRISARDLEDIQARAAQEGMPYQTLMGSVLHKFVTGRLVEASIGSLKPSEKKRTR